MEKYFLCLANSLKRGGRCIAGVEVKVDDNDQLTVVKSPLGIPCWIRPIDLNTEFGEIPNKTAQAIPLLSVVRLTEVEPCPHQAHAEDVYFLRMEVVGNILPCRMALEPLIDTLHDCLFYDSERSISTEQFARGNYSLMFIHACNVRILPDASKKRAKYRMEFTFRGHYYNMPVTDPDYLNYLENRAKGAVELQELYLTLSLGMVYEGRHHKLIAGVISPDSNFDAGHSTSQGLILRRKREPTWRKCEERILTRAECAAILSATYTPTYKGPAVYLRWKNGTSCFLPIEDIPDMEPRKRLALCSIVLVTYEDEAGRVEKKVRIIKRPWLSLFPRMAQWFRRLLHF